MLSTVSVLVSAGDGDGEGEGVENMTGYDGCGGSGKRL